MKIKDANKLIEVLDENLSWRKKEIIDYRFIIERNRGSLLLKPLLRGGITVIYAHWEGFIKEASEYYLNYITIKKIPYREISKNFITLSLYNRIKNANNFEDLHDQICKLFNDGEICKIPYQKVLDTNSNLNSKVLRNFIISLGFDYSHYKTKEKFIDKNLLATRNEIAHGEYKLITYDDFFEVYSLVLPLMDYFKTQICNAVINKDFIKTTSA
jgi:hypothetical protein